jgi:hypothetical protein
MDESVKIVSKMHYDSRIKESMKREFDDSATTR